MTAKPIKNEIMDYLRYYSYSSEVHKISKVRFIKDSASWCSIERGDRSSVLIIDKSLLACRPLMMLEINRLVKNLTLRRLYKRYPAAISSIVGLLFEAEQFVSLPDAQKKAIIRYLKLRHDSELIRVVFEGAIKNSTYGMIDEIIARLGSSREARYSKFALTVQSMKEKKIDIKKRVIDLFLYLQFGIDDPLNEYTQKKWLYHRKQLKLILDKKFDKITPVMVDIVPSLECIQNCHVCSNVDWRLDVRNKDWFNKRPEERMMTKEGMFRIIDNIRKAGAKAVVFTGGGEPLTNPHTVDGIVYARKSGLEVGLYTNGILFTKEIIDTLIKHKLTFIRISLNAGSSSLHASLGGYDSRKRYYESVIASLRYLSGQNKKTGKKCTIGIGYIVNPWNINDVYSVAKVLKKIDSDPAMKGGISYYVIRPTVVHRGYRGGRQFNKRIFEKAHTIIQRKVIPLLKKTDIRVIEIQSRFQAVHSHEKPFDKCLANPIFSLVGPDGAMYLCAESYHGHKRCRFGNLTEQGLGTIFAGKERKKIVDAIDYRYCPPVCKIHELNKIFDRLSRVDRDTMKYIKAWMMSRSSNTPPPAHVNFL